LVALEMARLSGIKLTKQEATFILLMGGGMALPWFNDLIFYTWFKYSDVAAFFGITEQVPWWATASREAFEMRNLFHPTFLTPISLRLIYSFSSGFFLFGLAFLFRKLYMEIERLPFPIQQMSARTIIVLTEEEEKTPIRLLCFTALLSFIWAFILYAVPFIFQIITGEYREILPIPWIDWTLNIEKIMPGAILGVYTDLVPFALGFLLPPVNIIQMLIASIAIYIIGNRISIEIMKPYGPFNWWMPGMSSRTALQRSILYIWAPYLIGFSFAAGLAPLIFNLPRII
ncbi:MAG: hypothetical protein QXR45_15005, partial [Candidatus Bathyarchaeia archaeon]